MNQIIHFAYYMYILMVIYHRPFAILGEQQSYVTNPLRRNTIQETSSSKCQFSLINYCFTIILESYDFIRGHVITCMLLLFAAGCGMGTSCMRKDSGSVGLD